MKTQRSVALLTLILGATFFMCGARAARSRSTSGTGRSARAGSRFSLPGVSMLAFSAAMAFKVSSPDSSSFLQKLLVHAGAIGMLTTLCLRRFYPRTVEDWFTAYHAFPYDRAVIEVDQEQQRALSLNPAYIHTMWESAQSIQIQQLNKYKKQLTKDLDRRFKKDPVQDIIDDSGMTYASKLLLPPDARVFYFGDQHGNISALTCTFQYLYEQGKIDEHFRILNSQEHYLFGGDFVDGGLFGVEVTTLLAYFLIQNRHNVHLIRGNHEEMDFFRQKYESGDTNMTASELEASPHFGKQLFRYERSYAGDKPNDLFQSFARFCHTMPSVIYVYVGNEGVPPVQCAYLQYCHGGFELRRDPTPYLDSADLYTAITYPSTYDARPTQSQIDTLIIHMETPPSARPNLYNTLNCDFFNTDNTRIGLRWTDYATPEKSCSGTRSTYDSRLQRMMYGSSLIKTLPEITGKRVIALFRAHQHHSSMQPILEPSNGGLYILHKNPGCTSRPDADFPIPIVTTVASSELYQMPCFVEYHHKTQKLIHHFMPDYRPDNTRSLWQTRTGPLHSWKNLRENGLPPRPRPMYKIHSQLFDESYYIPSS